MDTKEYWKNKHGKYSLQDWITKPTLFSQFAVKYFPGTGKLLELGAGQGQDSRFFARKGFDVTSTDFSDDALVNSKSITEKADLKIKFKNVDLSETLPFESESFDVVYSHLSLHYFSNQRTQKLFLEISKILKRGGIFATLVNTKDDPEVSNSKEIENGLYETPSGIVKRFFTIDEMAELTKSMYLPLVLDNKGETYKDEIKTLVRFVGKKI